MSGVIFHLDAHGYVCGGVSGLEGHDFLKALAKLPHVPLTDDDVAWPEDGPWEYPHMAQERPHDPLNARAAT